MAGIHRGELRMGSSCHRGGCSSLLAWEPPAWQAESQDGLLDVELAFGAGDPVYGG